MIGNLPPAREKFERQPVARPLIPLTLALALGVASSAWGIRLSGPCLAIAFFAFFFALVMTGLTGRNARLMPLALFWLLGLALAQQALNPALPAHHVVNLPQEQEIRLKGHLYQPPQPRDGGVRLFLEAGAWLSPQGWQRTSGKVLITGGPQVPVPSEGADLVVRTELRRPRDQLNPGAFQRSRYWASRGIFREGRLKEPADLIMLAPRQPPALRERLREGLRRLLAPLDQVSRALYLALILGDQGEITQAMRQAFSRTGTSHLLAISGLHLGMLAGLGFLAVFWLLRRFPSLLLRINAVKLATVLAAGPVVAYAWIAGGSPSTQRAEIMILAYLLLVLLGRPREVPSALALAALIILVLSPLLLFSLSFQLSFISVAALVYFLPRWLAPPDPERLPRSPGRKWGRRTLFWVKGALCASFVATLATAPLVAASFHLVSILGVVINLAAIPLVNGLAVPLGLLALTAESLHLTPLAQGLLALGQIPLKLAYTAISWGAAMPGSAFTLPAPTWLQIALFFALALLAFPPKRTAATWGGTVLVAAILVGSVVASLHRTSQACELTCLDSYTGLAGVLVTPDDRRLVISAGWPAWPGREGGSVGPLPGYLHWRQFRRLDEVMALSLTSQNAPELFRMAQEFRLGEVWFAGGERRPEVIQVRNLMGDQGHPARSLVRGEPPAALGGVKLTYYALENGRGAALGITCSGRRVVIFPPIRLSAPESPQVAADAPLEALVIPREPSPEWLAALKPKYVLVYGMPERDLPRLESRPQIHVLYTREGAVTLYLTSTGLTLKQWRR